MSRPQDFLSRALVLMGFDLSLEHTKETPRRVHRYLSHWAYWKPTPEFRVTCFPNTQPRIDQMVVVRGIPFWSCCSHHMLPFFGKVTVGYIPDEKVIGLSRIPMIVQWIAKKPQVQEHLAHEVADYLEGQLAPVGLAVYIRAWHTCQMLDVGPEAPEMVTTVLRGVLKSAPARAEFLNEVTR